MLQSLTRFLKGWKLYIAMVFRYDGYVNLSMKLCLNLYLSGFLLEENVDYFNEWEL